MDSSSFPDGETQDTAETFTTQSTPNQGKRKETNGDTSGQPNEKKTAGKRSKVWKHFDPLEEDKDKCICRHCKRVYGCASSKGTSNLGKHMLTCKKLLAFEASKSADTRAVTKDGRLVEAKVSEDIFKVATDELLVLGELPLAFIESMAWRHFCSRVNLYTPHSRRTATRNIVKMYEERRAGLKVWIAANKQRVSLTTDIWVAQATGASYMVITAHFIDANWEMRKLIIGFKYITDHKGTTITRVLMECLAEWGIQKIFTITVDNATANTSALKRFQTQFSLVSDEALVLDGEFMHMRCCAHIINLIVKEGLLELVDNVCAIRNAVTYVRASTNRIDTFDSRADNAKVTRGSLPLDIKTRWNSTYLMLLQAIKFRKAFDKMEAEDRLYNDYFLEQENGQKRIGPPTEVDWNAVERLVRFLIIFYNSTLIVSASNSVSSYKCYTEIVTIEKNLMNLSNSLDRELSEKADDMRGKFDKYWDGVKNINRLLIVASVLDPSKKMQFAKICFERLYGKDTAQAIKDVNETWTRRNNAFWTLRLTTLLSFHLIALNFFLYFHLVVLWNDITLVMTFVLLVFSVWTRMICILFLG
ncbi:unnamed protein product [Microthlaspi erraticum]|uniref:BED-type domain-containing protein n=1 Tax=Microthlaspi erraticum TaxID=1685480 RepID=A0A6D2J9Z4_9BRAS|nr:unnamed protein product [Microthlaspi erraticum]